MPQSPFNVMSYNIRNTNAPDGPNHWQFRREFWASTVRDFDPDLLGLQEVLADQYDQLVEIFPDYRFVGVAREDGVRRGEWALILFRASRFQEIECGNFWLSETPDVVGSRSWDSACVRICTWVRLRDRESGRIVLHANTHFDHEGHIARRESARLLRRRLAKLAAGAAIILTGDFNSGDQDEPYDLLLDRSQPDGLALFDSYRELHTPAPEEASFHGFTGVTAGHRIDWILHSPGLETISAEIRRDRAPDGRYPSDHFAVTATVTWASRPRSR
jgi:endonuclease/exonuclease/phosphatase family metal-dependent hydrolase